jgi:TIR domain
VLRAERATIGGSGEAPAALKTRREGGHPGDTESLRSLPLGAQKYVAQPIGHLVGRGPPRAAAGDECGLMPVIECFVSSKTQRGEPAGQSLESSPRIEAPMPYKVFISHASRDRWAAGQIAKELEAAGASCFLDSETLETGDPIDANLKAALRGADELLVLLTPTALERPYLWLEIGVAWGRETRIVGILYGLTTAELAARDGTPGFMTDIVLRDIEDLERYAEELKRRLEEEDENG